MSLALLPDELAFSLLLDSHALVCRPLFGLALAAAKAHNPLNWKDVICACLGHGVGRHVKKKLDNGMVLTDIYPVCRIFASRINDVVEFCGGSLRHPRVKERLSLQVQGVETARHWAFHGGQLSPSEVSSSISLMLSVCGGLSAQVQDDEMFPLGLAENLSVRLEAADMLCCWNTDANYPIQQAEVVGKALLWKALSHFERNFSSYFQEIASRSATQASSDESLRTFQARQENAPGQEFLGLLKKIRRAYRELDKEPTDSGGQDASPERGNWDCGMACKRILSGRNALSHGLELSVSKAAGVASDICNLICAFHLNGEECRSARQRIESVATAGKGQLTCTLSKLPCPENEPDKYTHRISRPRANPFVGRQTELLSMKTLFEKMTDCRRVLIHGPAGIGKSSLATEVAAFLAKTHKRQTWLSCSSLQQLEEDMARQTPTNTPLCKLRYGKLGRAEQAQPWKILCIFDDVCFSSLQRVRAFVETATSDIVITTRSTAVKIALQSVVKFSETIHLKAFSKSESRQLVKKKIKMLDTDMDKLLPCLNECLNDALGHLPLCVSVFSSLLAFKKTQSLKTSTESPPLPLPPPSPLSDWSMLSLGWREIEERFPDRLHVLGLTGVVQCAEEQMSSQPLSMLLLVKICLANSEKFPWKLASLGRHRVAWESDATAEVNFGKWFPHLFFGLLGVTDWLFSDKGHGALERCRETLEELGIIGWNECTSTVHIHSLMLHSVKVMLHNRRLFLDALVHVAAEDFSENMQLDIGSETLALHVSEQLRCQIMLKGLHLLLTETEQSGIKCNLPTEGTVCSFALLSSLLEACPATAQKAAPVHSCADLIEFCLVDALRQFAVHFSINLSERTLTSWRCLQQKLARESTSRLGFLQITDRIDHVAFSHSHWVEGIKKFCQNDSDEALTSFAMALADARFASGENSILVAGVHSCIGVLLENKLGAHARRRYLTKAAQSCCRLLAEPTIKNIQFALTALQENGLDGAVIGEEYFETVYDWFSSLEFRVLDCLHSNKVDEKTQGTASHLIDVVHALQKSLLEQLQQLPTQHKGGTAKEDEQYCYLATLADLEYSLWHILGSQCAGRQLRASIKTYLLIEAYTIRCGGKRFSDKKVVSDVFFKKHRLAEQCCHAAWLVGQFSIASTFACPTESALHGKIGKNSSDSGFQIESQNLSRPGYSLQAYKGLQLCYENRRYQEALDELLPFLKDCVTDGELLCTSFLSPAVIVDHIKTLSLMLGQDVCKSTALSLTELCKDIRVASTEKEIIQLFIPVIPDAKDNHCKLSNVHMLLRKANRDLQASGSLCARPNLLKCLREVVSVLEEISSSKARDKLALDTVLASVAIFLSDGLQRSYAEEEKHDVAEWFVKFCVRLSRDAGWAYLVGKYGMQYAESLKERGQWSEALQQCHLVRKGLVEAFGDDYQEWLPNAPNQIDLLQSLERIDEKTKSVEG